jgi:hypothetical protein
LVWLATSTDTSVPNGDNGCSQPKVTDAKQGWLSLPHMHKSRLDFPEPDIQAVKRGFLPSMSAVSPILPNAEWCMNFCFYARAKTLQQQLLQF